MKIAFIGAGNMGEAILSRLYRQHGCVVCEANEERRAKLKKKYRCVLAESPADAAASADVVVLAVKPQDLAVVLEAVRPAVARQLFLSIAAGVTTRFIEKALGGKARVVRSMPNLPAMIGEGISALARGRLATEKDIAAARGILQAVGDTVVVPEKMIDAVTAVSGSGPAYVFLFVECMMKAARKLGLKEAQAQRLVYQTLLGSAHMLAQSQDSAVVLRQKVTSKGGTTQAATDVFMQRDIMSVFSSALEAARDRARELAK